VENSFLSVPWFEELNARLARSAAAPLPQDAHACQIVLDITDGPATLPSALTLSITDAGARVSSGDSSTADAVLRLSFDDALAMTAGTLDSAAALREGRIKVRGDVNVLVPLATWLHTALFG
jgi:putative sterol carrier protein